MLRELQAGARSERIQRSATLALEQLRRLASLEAELLDVARLNTGKLPSGYTGTDSRTLSAKYGFTLSNTGAGVATYVVPAVGTR